MSINLGEIVSNGLSLLTYNGNQIKAKADQPNIYLGIGLWSVRDRLSHGLPVDVMLMLLSATVMRLNMEANLRKSKIIVLIADSMAIREGGEREQVEQVVQIYKRSLEPLLELLKIRESCEIVLSSDLEKNEEYQGVLRSVEKSTVSEQLKIGDRIHHAYICTQTAITHYMEKYKKVGVKVGWICTESSKELSVRAPQALNRWDELKFDRWCDVLCPDSTIQYLYAKAGLKQSGKSNRKNVSVNEGCPYTAYPRDRRYVVQIEGRIDIKTICWVRKRAAAHWKGVAELCSELISANLVNSNLLPKNCIQENNRLTTVYSMLNHWSNPPLLPIEDANKDSILL